MLPRRNAFQGPRRDRECAADRPGHHLEQFAGNMRPGSIAALDAIVTRPGLALA